jgi:uncharacterized membrane protein
MENSQTEKLNRIKKNVAIKRVRKMKRFYIHLVFFIAVNIVVAAINFKATPEVLWFYWLPLGWGIAILMHFMSVFSLKDWESRMVKELMEKDE